MTLRRWVSSGLVLSIALFTGIASPYEAPSDEGPDIVRGEAYRQIRGNLSLYVPPELAVNDDRFDLVVHFHGAAKLQEDNVREAGLRGVVVSVNEGVGSTSYSRNWASPGSLDRVVRYVEEEVAKQRFPGARVGRIALSSWSAGGAAVKEILERDASRVDAVLIADGIFSTYENPKQKTIRRGPLMPIIDFARQAARGEKAFVLTHTAIAPTLYPNVGECTAFLLSEVELGPADGPTYTISRGHLRIEGSPGTGAEDHIAQIQALDAAYALLRRRWHH